jgi:hypothetical protein
MSEPTNTPASLRESLATIRKHAPTFNTLSDQVNEVVSKVERFLAEECSIGIQARVIVATGDDGEVTLEYRRYERHFRIVVVQTDPTGIEKMVQPWSECIRGLKIKAAHCLPKLVAEIADTIQQQFAETEAAANAVRDALTVLPPPALRGQILPRK